MRVTREMYRQIIACAKANFRGRLKLACNQRAAHNSGAYTENALLWGSEWSGWQGRLDIDGGFNVTEDVTMPRCALLDVRVYDVDGDSEDLIGNVYVTIKGGKVVDVHAKDFAANLRAVQWLGVPYGDDRDRANEPIDYRARYMVAAKRG